MVKLEQNPDYSVRLTSSSHVPVLLLNQPNLSGVSVTFSPFQYCMCFALTASHENIFPKISVDGRPVNTRTQLSRLIWWKCNATCWVYFSSEADVCFVNCLPARIGFSIVAAKSSFLTAFLFFGEAVSKSRGQRNKVG